MPAWTEPRGRPTHCLWRGGAVIYLAMLLAALAAGLWPEAIHHSHVYRPDAPLPTLQTLAVAQCCYFLLVWPIVIAARSDARRGPLGAAAVAETIVLVVAAIPLYVAGAYFADATVVDWARTATAVCGQLPLAWAGSLWIATYRPGRPWVALNALALVFGGAVGWYVIRDLLGGAAGGAAEAAWQISPITFAWQAAQSQGRRWFAEPLWPMAAWALAAAIAGLANLALVHGRRHKIGNGQ